MNWSSDRARGTHNVSVASSEERALEAELQRLEEEERDLSLLRRRLHDRMAIFPDAEGAQELAAREADLSKQRREVHRRIDELRAQRNVLRSRRAE